MQQLTRVIVFGTLWMLFCQAEPAPPPPARCEAPAKAKAPDDGLWAWFTFDDGKLIDQSGRNHPLRMEGVQGTDYVSDEGFLIFEGKGAFAVIDSGRVFPKGDFALAVSVFAEQNLQGRIFNRANYFNALGASLTLGFELVFEGRLCYGVTQEPDVCGSYSDLYNTSALLSSSSLEPGAWHEIVIQFEQGIQSMYIDGALSAREKTPEHQYAACPDAPFYFGQWWNHDPRPFIGKLDNIRIYERALTEHEIKALYQANRAPAWLSAR